jgi:hypothetical protein
VLFAPELLDQSLQHLRCQLVMRLVTQSSLVLVLLQHLQLHLQLQKQRFQEHLQFRQPHRLQHNSSGQRLEVVQAHMELWLTKLEAQAKMAWAQQQLEHKTGQQWLIMSPLQATQQQLSHCHWASLQMQQVHTLFCFM